MSEQHDIVAVTKPTREEADQLCSIAIAKRERTAGTIKPAERTAALARLGDLIERQSNESILVMVIATDKDGMVAALATEGPGYRPYDSERLAGTAGPALHRVCVDAVGRTLTLPTSGAR